MDSLDNSLVGYVGVSEAELSELNLEHLASALDSSIAVPGALGAECEQVLTGYTEWAGSFRNAVVTLGWDWVLCRGSLRVLDVAEIRTNIRLLAEDGSARAPATSRRRLALWIDTLPWRATAREVVAGQA